MQKEEVFLSVIESHKGILYKVVNAYCKDEENRKDLIQEIIFQLWKSFDRYNNQYKYSTWIYRIALNVSISFYRRESVRQPVTGFYNEQVLQVTEEWQHSEKDEHLQQLHQFIAELRDMDRALMLLYLEEKSYKEMAEITGLSETNIGTRIGRIKMVLKQKFSKMQ